MTELATFTARLNSIFGGDYFENSRKFFKVQTHLKSNLSADCAGPQRYEENLTLESQSYTQELADKRREIPFYPPEVEELVKEKRAKISKSAGLVAGLFIIAVVLFMIFGGGPTGTRLLLGGIGGFIVLSVIAGRVAWLWRTFKLYIDKDYLYKLPDEDFVPVSEQEEFQARRRQEDSVLINRLAEMREAALTVLEDFTGPSDQLYNIDRDGHLAVIALQSAIDGEQDEVHGDYDLPVKAAMADPERYRSTRENNSALSSRANEDLMHMELMIKTISDSMNRV